jgi:hypothetical protein
MLCSGDTETESRGRDGCYFESHWYYYLWERLASLSRLVQFFFYIFEKVSCTNGQYIINLGSIVQLQKGDILGHEFCGEVDSLGSAVKNLKKGQRVVASFQIACGDCMYCKKKMSSQCERTNANKTQTTMFGGKTGG